MKKIISMLIFLLCAIFVVHAESITDLSQLRNNGIYTLRSARAFLFYSKASGVSGQICSNTGTAVGTVTQNPLDPAQQFKIEKDGNNYYLYSVGAEKYVNANGNYEETPSAPLTFENVGGTYPWKLLLGGNGMNSQINNQMASGIVVNSHTKTDEGNCYIIEIAEIKPVNYTIQVLGTDDSNAGVVYNEVKYNANATFTSDALLKKSDFTPNVVEGKIPVVTIDESSIYVSYFDENTKFYTIRNGKGGYVSISPDYMSGTSMLLSNSDTPQDNMGIWAFEKQSNNTYKIYNYSTGLSKVLGIKGSEDNARTSMVSPEATTHSTSFSGKINLDGTESYIKKDGTSDWLNMRGDYLALWTFSDVTGDVGSKFFMEEVNFADFPDEYYYEVLDIEGIESYSPKNPNTLWYRTSAEATGVSYPWMEYALPLGNGELGCMVFGGVHNEELQFNEKTLWSGPANTVGAGGGNRTYMNFGSLLITNQDKAIWEGVTDYVRFLDIEEGIAGVEFKNANGTKQIRRFFSSAPDQTIVGHYTVEGDDKINLLFRLEPGNDIGAGNVTYENGTASFTGKMTAVQYATRLHVTVNEGATITASSKGISVKDATEVTFFLKGATNFNGDMDVFDNYFTSETANDVDNRIKSELEKVATKKYEEIEADHIEDFTNITKRMTLDLGLQTPTRDTKELVDYYYPNNQQANSTDNDHLFLEQLYFHYGRYLAISSNRKPIAAPNNLQGIWNDRGTDSPWNSDIHTNINIQMNYWPTEPTNLSDLHKPFVNFIVRGAQSEGWKKVAEKYNKSKGWSVLTESSLYNSMSTWGDNYFVANVWYCSHLWQHYRYTLDKEFLAKAFPAMWSCAEFWFERMIKDRKVNDGTWVCPNEYSPEQNDHPTEDATAHAQQMVYMHFVFVKEAIEVLGQEACGLTDEQVAKLDDYIANTDQGLHTEEFKGGTWASWGTQNGVSKGDLLMREWKYTDYDVSGDKGHRHISHLMCLYPYDQVTPESEYFTPAVNSLKLRGDAATGWSMGWKVNLWARAQDGNHAHVIIKNALKHSTTYGTDQGQGGIYYNLFDSHAPFQIDGNFGVCSGIAEMLMQSAHGYISILPALPNVWKEGAVTGMKAIGDFTVDFEWEDNKATIVRIHNNQGQECKVKCPGIGNAYVFVNHEKVQVEALGNDVYRIPSAQKGDYIVINYTEETAVEDTLAEEVEDAEVVYDLMGRKVENPTVKGIYVKGGEKFLVK